MQEINQMRFSEIEPHTLSAGPISFTFCRGELRYLCLEDEEIIRRIYFSVRDEKWNTIIPQLSDLQILTNAEECTISYNAVCKDENVDFNYHLDIKVKSIGKIFCKATGRSQQAGKANRFGLCVHLGSAAVCGLPFTTFKENSETNDCTFSGLIDEVILADKFYRLDYTSIKQKDVSIQIKGAIFGLEDQRHFGDSSFKLFSGMPYNYPIIDNLEEHSEELNIEIKNVHLSADPLVQSENTISIGNIPTGKVLPNVQIGDDRQAAGFFIDAWAKRKEWASSTEVSWEFNPSVNLSDNDTLNENLPVVIDQANTIKKIAPGAKLKVKAISFSTPKTEADSRYYAPYQAAWIIASVKYLALAGVDEATFKIPSYYGEKAIIDLQSYAGSMLLPVKLSSEETKSGERKYDAMAFLHESSIYIYLINLSEEYQTLDIVYQSKRMQKCILPPHGTMRFILDR